MITFYIFFQWICKSLLKCDKKNPKCNKFSNDKTNSAWKETNDQLKKFTTLKHMLFMKLHQKMAIKIVCIFFTNRFSWISSLFIIHWLRYRACEMQITSENILVFVYYCWFIFFLNLKCIFSRLFSLYTSYA